MARIRTVKPEFWIDEKIVDLSMPARLLFIGLWNFADDQGYVDDKPRRIKMQVFPGDDVAVDPLIEELVDAGLVVRYDSQVGPLLHIKNWEKHQKVDRASAARFDPSTLVVRTLTPPRLVTPQVSAGRESSTSPRECSPASLDAEGKGSGSGRDLDLDLDLEGIGQLAPKRARGDAEFDRFWAAYPRHVAKAAARKAWDRAIRTVDPDRILAAAQRYRDDPGREAQFTAHPATWLNAGRWEDDPLPRGSPRGFVDRNGFQLKPETVANLEREARLAQLDAQHNRPAIGGPP